MNVVTEAIDLAREILRKTSHKSGIYKCNLAQEKGSAIADEDFIYILTDTPQVFVDAGIMTIIAFGNGYYDYRQSSFVALKGGRNEEREIIDRDNLLNLAGLHYSFIKPDIKGLMAVDIDLNNLREWFNKKNRKKLGNDEPKTKEHGIKGLYYLSENPKTAILYAGKNKVTKDWKNTKGKTQSWAILKLAADKYNRNINKNLSESSSNLTKLSLAEIKDYIDNSENCNQRRNWKNITVAEKKRLYDFMSNILKFAQFTKNELYIEQSSHLVFCADNSS